MDRMRRRDRVRSGQREEHVMAVTSFQDLPVADTDREWDGDAADERVRRWA